MKNQAKLLDGLHTEVFVLTFHGTGSRGNGQATRLQIKSWPCDPVDFAYPLKIDP